MSLFARSIRLQSSKIPSLWGCAHHSSRSIATASIPLDGGDTPDILAPRGFAFPSLFPSINLNFPFNNNVGAIAITTNTPSLPSIGATLIEDTLQSLLDMSTWFIKRTYQPSIIRKRRKHGFLRRKKSVGGRRVLARRKAKGRARLGGS